MKTLLLSLLLLPFACQSPRPEEPDDESDWVVLFDGETTRGWRGFRKEACPEGWQVVDGCLARVGPGGDIISEEVFEDFVLRLEWKISPNGNSGIFFHVTEDEDTVWKTGPEFQVLDNAGHANGQNLLTSAGSNYALHAPIRDVTRPVGEFNEAEIEVRDGHVHHRLNGVEIVSYQLGSAEWEALVQASKFGKMPAYGRSGRGHIALQDHGDAVWYRNIRVRRLP